MARTLSPEPRLLVSLGPIGSVIPGQVDFLRRFHLRTRRGPLEIHGRDAEHPLPVPILFQEVEYQVPVVFLVAGMVYLVPLVFEQHSDDPEADTQALVEIMCFHILAVCLNIDRKSVV